MWRGDGIGSRRDALAVHPHEPIVRGRLEQRREDEGATAGGSET